MEVVPYFFIAPYRLLTLIITANTASTAYTTTRLYGLQSKKAECTDDSSGLL